MTEIFEGTYQNGVFVPSTPVEMPEGTKVEIRVPNRPFRRMMREENWPTTPEEVEAHIQRMQSFEPCVLTEAEEADLAAWRAGMERFNVDAIRKQMGLGNTTVVTNDSDFSAIPGLAVEHWSQPGETA